MTSAAETAAATTERAEALAEILAERILVLDGATGTWLQGENLTPADFGGEQYEGCNEHLVLTRPDVVRKMHESYLEAGADMVETDTFGGTPLVLAEYGLAEKAFEINAAAARIAREAAARFSTSGRPRFVAGSMGPTTRSVTVTGGDLRRTDRPLQDPGGRAHLRRRGRAASRDGRSSRIRISGVIPGYQP